MKGGNGSKQSRRVGFWFITLYNRDDEGGFVHNFWFVLYIYRNVSFETFTRFKVFFFFNFIFFESCMRMCDKLSWMARWLSEWT